jgi:hypothetical protein
MIVPRSLHYAARRARMRRGRENRVASVGMTKPREICAEFTEGGTQRSQRKTPD